MDPNFRPDFGDEDDEQHLGALRGGEWAFFWAAVTIACVGLLALVGQAWRAWPWW